MQGKNCWCLGIIIFLSISLVSAVRINEVSPKNEFIEIYSEDNLNLSEWRIKDSSTNKPDSIECSECQVKGYLVLMGKSSNLTGYYLDDSLIGNGLNDKGDNISFYNLNNGETYFFSYNNSEENKSWQYFEDGWKLCDITPGEENKCKKIIKENIETMEEKKEIIGNINENIEEDKQDNEESPIIRLNSPKDIKSNKIILFKSKTQYMKEYGIYGFAILCVLIIIILIIKGN